MWLPDRARRRRRVATARGPAPRGVREPPPSIEAGGGVTRRVDVPSTPDRRPCQPSRRERPPSMAYEGPETPSAPAIVDLAGPAPLAGRGRTAPPHTKVLDAGSAATNALEDAGRTSLPLAPSQAVEGVLAEAQGAVRGRADVRARAGCWLRPLAVDDRLERQPAPAGRVMRTSRGTSSIPGQGATDRRIPRRGSHHAT